MRDVLFVDRDAIAASLLVVISMMLLLTGCRADHIDPGASAPREIDLDAELQRASQTGAPIVVAAIEPGRSAADDSALRELQGTGAIVLDLTNSHNRAAALRYHAEDAPLLVAMTPREIIVSRDVGKISRAEVQNRVAEASRAAPGLDATFNRLKQGADPRERMDLADFLLAQHNAREAIPYLEAVAHSTSTPTDERVGAWVKLVRAHQWIGEPEKGRHEAEHLLAELGAQSPLARAGGNLVLGLQDRTAKRVSRAQAEFEAAIAAGPNSPYAEEARHILAEMDRQGK